MSPAVARGRMASASSEFRIRMAAAAMADISPINTSAGCPLGYQRAVTNCVGNPPIGKEQSMEAAPGDPNNPHLHPYFTVQNREFIVRHTFNMVGEKNALIKDPLWYAGKYG